MPAWITIVLSALGMIFSGYELIKRPSLTTAQPVIQSMIQRQNQSQNQNQQSVFAYCQINIAYDIVNNKHWFQHPDGQWRDFPPTPAQMPLNQ